MPGAPANRDAINLLRARRSVCTALWVQCTVLCLKLSVITRVPLIVLTGAVYLLTGSRGRKATEGEMLYLRPACLHSSRTAFVPQPNKHDNFKTQNSNIVSCNFSHDLKFLSHMFNHSQSRAALISNTGVGDGQDWSRK